MHRIRPCSYYFAFTFNMVTISLSLHIIAEEQEVEKIYILGWSTEEFIHHHSEVIDEEPSRNQKSKSWSSRKILILSTIVSLLLQTYFLSRAPGKPRCIPVLILSLLILSHMKCRIMYCALGYRSCLNTSPAWNDKIPVLYSIGVQVAW